MEFARQSRARQTFLKEKVRRTGDKWDNKVLGFAVLGKEASTTGVLKVSVVVIVLEVLKEEKRGT